ncbi:nucleoid-associated protein [Olivibacter sitiensis]|uniref:nucleoid-associated protein n=1 Tax=Olivibacter sitiensis TaxID=376470 RepID=UPI0003FD64F2|nr:nucleoid-associated protein [Olivibacter sitiensis]
MLTFFEAFIAQLSIHRVGNKLQDEHYILSEAPIQINDELLSKLLMQYFLSPFEKVNEVYRFYHSSEDLQLNELHSFASAYFKGDLKFHEMSERVTKHLHEASNHPKIKAGEVYVVFFNNVQLEGEVLDAIGVFKSENKETYLKVYPEQGAFRVDYEEQAINIHKLDKGCLILNTEREEGFKVLAIDQTNRQQEAVYWKDDFLQVKVRNDNYHQTGNVLQLCKKFVTEKLDESFDMERADKIDLLNRSVGYFKEKEQFDLDEFAEEVLGNPQATELFKSYKHSFEEDFDTAIPEQFDISEQAVKQQNKNFKSVLKLDRNFHVYVHGKREYLEKGFDEDRQMNYYKLYFEKES